MATAQLASLVLIVLGIFIGIFGDRKVDSDGGKISRAFSMPALNAKVLKWGVALLFMAAGIALLLQTAGP